jgi:hypothetical protein
MVLPTLLRRDLLIERNLNILPPFLLNDGVTAHGTNRDVMDDSAKIIEKYGEERGHHRLKWPQPNLARGAFDHPATFL